MASFSAWSVLRASSLLLTAPSSQSESLRYAFWSSRKSPYFFSKASFVSVSTSWTGFSSGKPRIPRSLARSPAAFCISCFDLAESALATAIAASASVAFLKNRYVVTARMNVSITNTISAIVRPCWALARLAAICLLPRGLGRPSWPAGGHDNGCYRHHTGAVSSIPPIVRVAPAAGSVRPSRRGKPVPSRRSAGLPPPSAPSRPAP